jgi:hypothetical protein
MIVGLLVEPLLRHHPLRREVQAIYEQIRRIITAETNVLSLDNHSHGVAQTSHPQGCENPVDILGSDFLSVLAKSIYEYVIWTFPGTDTYMRRVNQQIRYAYFYCSLWFIYKGAVYAALLSLCLKFLFHQRGNVLVAMICTFVNTDRIDHQLLMSVPPYPAAIALLLLILVGYFPARFFYSIGQETMIVELYSRHIVLLQNTDLIRRIARNILSDPELLRTYADRAAGLQSNSNSGYRRYWSFNVN